MVLVRCNLFTSGLGSTRPSQTNVYQYRAAMDGQRKTPRKFIYQRIVLRTGSERWEARVVSINLQIDIC